MESCDFWTAKEYAKLGKTYRFLQNKIFSILKYNETFIKEHFIITT